MENSVIKIAKIYTALTAVVIAFVVMFLCNSCTESIATTTNTSNVEIDFFAEDNYCLADNWGIVLQEVSFTNGKPQYQGKDVIFSPDCCGCLSNIFNNPAWEFHQVAAVAYDCKDYFYIDLD